jgi:hypothetical protein
MLVRSHESIIVHQLYYIIFFGPINKVIHTRKIKNKKTLSYYIIDIV